MVKGIVEEKITTLPNGVSAKVESRIVTISGPLGELTRDFTHTRVDIALEDGKIILRAHWPRKADIALLRTVDAHIKNMIKGVTTGFTYRLKIAYSHFPVTVKVQGDRLIIENFTGERSPRVSRITPGCKVTVKGDDVTVQGIDLERVSQTAANIQEATKIKQKDPRVFLDGIYVEQRAEGM